MAESISPEELMSRNRLPVAINFLKYYLCAVILEQPMGVRNKEGIGCRTSPPGYIGWRNRFLGINSGLLKSLEIPYHGVMF
jgi:hypothetical protein